MAKLTATKLGGKRGVTAAVCIAALAVWLGFQGRGALATPPAAPASAAPPAAPASPVAPSTAAPSAKPASANVQITFTTMPPAKASVSWGSTLLGRTSAAAPLVVTRPRDSGPLDVVVRAQGFLPVQTRAHTFEDTTLQVKLTRPSQQSTLVGYRQPLDAGVPLGEEGVPPLLSDVPLAQPAPAPSPLQYPSVQPNAPAPLLAPTPTPATAR